MFRICMHEHRDKKKPQTVINLTDIFFPLACDLPCNKDQGTHLLFTSNQPKYLHCFARFKQLVYCDVQDWYQVWNIARFLKLLYFKHCWFGNENCDKLLLSAFISQIITITFNSRGNLSSISRSSQLLPRFSDCMRSFCALKALYQSTRNETVYLRNATFLDSYL